MKKINLYLSILAIATLVIAVSCNNNAPSGEAYTLKMRMAKGDSFSHETIANIKTSTEAMGQKITMNVDMNAVIGFNVMNTAPDSTELRMTYNKMDYNASMDGIPGDNSEAMNKGTKELSERIVGKSMLLYVNDKNEITNIEGSENVFGNMSEDPAVREQMKKMFSKEQLNQTLGMMFQMYPNKPVRVGEKWEKEMEMSVSSITMKVDMHYQLKSVKDGIAVVDVNGKINGKGTMAQGATPVEMVLEGGQKGTLSISLADGYLKSGDYTMDVKGNVEVMGMKVPMKVTGQYKLKGK